MSSPKDVQDWLEELSQRKVEWLRHSASYKLALLDELLERCKVYQDDFLKASVQKRHYDFNKANLQHMQDFACTTQTWMHTTVMLGLWLSSLREHYDVLNKTAAPPTPKKVTLNPDGTYKVQVGPNGLLLNVLLSFGSMELYVEGSADPQPPQKECPGLSLVLGAGNYDSPIDILASMFIQNNVCIYKWSPMSIGLRETLEQIFDPLVRRGYLRFVAIQDTQQLHDLVHSPKVDRLWMTGSRATANQLLFGQPDSPSETTCSQIEKPFCFELGNCTAWIVVPPGEGKNWSGLELYRHARQIAFAMLFNGGHVCAHVQLIITCRNWPQRDEFLKTLRAALQGAPVVGCFYQSFEKNLRDAKQKLIAEGQTEEDMVISVTVPNCGDSKKAELQETIFAVDIKHDSFLCKKEMFCPVAGEVALDTPNSPEEFLPAAVKFANEKCDGTLAVSLSMKTGSQKDEQALQKALCDLTYTAVSVNCCSVLCNAFPELIWGGYPGATIHDLQSGIGLLGNCSGYVKPLKCVMRQPFLNLGHYCVVLPSPTSIGRMDKTWRRVSTALCERRASQSHLGALWDLVKISSGLVLNI